MVIISWALELCQSPRYIQEYLDDALLSHTSLIHVSPTMSFNQLTDFLIKVQFIDNIYGDIVREFDAYHWMTGAYIW